MRLRSSFRPASIKSAGPEQFSLVLCYAAVVRFSSTMFQDGNNNRSTVAPMGGRFLLPFSADGGHRTSSRR
jgi:hypothetical protein